jgi:hypothetical protein
MAKMAQVYDDTISSEESGCLPYSSFFGYIDHLDFHSLVNEFIATSERSDS